jgi:sporulation protein YlmC with PRC-barrel domain
LPPHWEHRAERRSILLEASAPHRMIHGATVTDWYKQSVYDPSNSKIGEIMDVLLSSDGKVNALIVGVGGFLGMGEKDVAVPFSAVKHETRDGKVYFSAMRRSGIGRHDEDRLVVDCLELSLRSVTNPSFHAERNWL